RVLSHALAGRGVCERAETTRKPCKSTGSAGVGFSGSAEGVSPDLSRREHGRGGPTRPAAPRGALAARGGAVGSVPRKAEEGGAPAVRRPTTTKTRRGHAASSVGD